jgi:DNA-binding winged helix-turn-helix (wHTH) protein
MEQDNFYQFGPFSLDVNERVLLRDGRLVPLAPKALTTLLVLVRNQGRVVEKDTLMAEIWPDEVVEEGNLAQHIFMLRKVLGENNGLHSCIETVPRRGYRFVNSTMVRKTESLKTAPEKAAPEPEPKVSDAFEIYLKGRYEWAKQTKEGLERAAEYFREAINIDPDHMLAYIAIVDCYLRLASNYLPPADVSPQIATAIRSLETDDTVPDEVKASLAMRVDWDRRIIERESRHASQLKQEYPAVHQWRVAALLSQSLYHQNLTAAPRLPNHLQCAGLTLAEEVQICCVMARSQIDAGNYEAACRVLEHWWTVGKWPKLDGLSLHSSADLLFTVGALTAWMASSAQVTGYKQAEALVSGAIGISEQLGSRALSAEARIELGYCYNREGLFDLARQTLIAALEELGDEDGDLKSISLIRLASVERHGGRLRNSSAYLKSVSEIANLSPWAIGRYHCELGTGLSSADDHDALGHFRKAMEIFETIGNYRYFALAQNNYGNLLIKMGMPDEAEKELIESHRLFEELGDKVRRASVDDTLAQLYLATRQFELAEEFIVRSVDTFKAGGEEALLSESLTTQGRILARVGRHREAKRVLERACAVAERCGDNDGAARAIITEIEEMCEQLEDDEGLELLERLDQLLADSQQVSTLRRFAKCRARIAAVRATEKA